MLCRKHHRKLQHLFVESTVVKIVRWCYVESAVVIATRRCFVESMVEKYDPLCRKRGRKFCTMTVVESMVVKFTTTSMSYDPFLTTMPLHTYRNMFWTVLHGTSPNVIAPSAARGEVNTKTNLLTV